MILINLFVQVHQQNVRSEKIQQSDVFHEMRDLSRFYQEIEDDIKRTRMYLHNTLQLRFPEIERFFPSRVTPYALTLIELFPHPEFVLQTSKAKIKNLLIKSTTKRISENRTKLKASEIIEYAQEFYSTVSSNSVQN